jgi:Methyltransferase domain
MPPQALGAGDKLAVPWSQHSAALQGKIELGFFDRVRGRIRRTDVGTGGAWSPGDGASESDAATAYWAGLRDYHKKNDASRPALERSRWVSDVVGTLGVDSLLEVGTNSGRNLQVIRGAHPRVKLAGIDVNARAIAFSESKGLDIDFRIADANHWEEPANAWAAILTMSVLDHIPDDAVESLAANIVQSTSRYVIAVELWDGSHGSRGAFKYSRSTRDLFEKHGLHTLYWESSVGQYDTVQSRLWSYIGSRIPEKPLADR